MTTASDVPSVFDVIRNTRRVMKRLYFGQACFSQVRWGTLVDIGAPGALEAELGDEGCATWVDLRLQCRCGDETLTVRLDGLQRMPAREPGGSCGFRFYHVLPGTKVSEKRDLGAIALRLALLKHLGVPVLDLHGILVDKQYRRGFGGLEASRLLTTPNPAYYYLHGNVQGWQGKHALLRDAPAWGDPAFVHCLKQALEAVGPDVEEAESEEVEPPKPPVEWTGDDLLYGYALWGRNGALAPGVRTTRLVDLTDAEVARYSPGHRLQVAAAKQAGAGGDPELQWTSLGHTEMAKWLAGMVEPLYCFDLENYSTLIPLWEGVGPNEPVPFQYSLHVVSGGGVSHHRAFLHRGEGDPRWDFLEQLLWDVPLHEAGQLGTLLVYSNHEKQTLKKMLEGLRAVVAPTPGQAALRDGFAAWLRLVFPDTGSGRHVDLMKPFFGNHRDGFDAWIYHALQGRSASIKAVHPAMCGCTSPYAGLAIQDGLTANAAYLEAVFGDASPEEKARTFANLLAYCEVDTRVMVELAEKLRELIRE